MSMKICKTCASRQDCPKQRLSNNEDFCQCWEAEPEEERVNVLKRLAKLISFVSFPQEVTG